MPLSNFKLTFAGTSDCASWSSWGPCVFPSWNNRSYIAQLSSVCQSHWFYRFLSARYASALDSFFEYFRTLLLNPSSSRPCGLCSYRQSCGFGGPQKCHLSPFQVTGGRPILPFFVSEKVCNRRDLRGLDQQESCRLDYHQLLGPNGEECRLWPSERVNLSSVEPGFREQIQTLQWYSCLAVPEREDGQPAHHLHHLQQSPSINITVTPAAATAMNVVVPSASSSSNNNGNVNKVCRCCCFPFRPNPQTLLCEHIPGAPTAPGQEHIVFGL